MEVQRDHLVAALKAVDVNRVGREITKICSSALSCVLCKLESISHTTLYGHFDSTSRGERGGRERKNYKLISSAAADRDVKKIIKAVAPPNPCTNI